MLLFYDYNSYINFMVVNEDCDEDAGVTGSGPSGSVLLPVLFSFLLSAMDRQLHEERAERMILSLGRNDTQSLKNRMIIQQECRK